MKTYGKKSLVSTMLSLAKPRNKTYFVGMSGKLQKQIQGLEGY